MNRFFSKLDLRDIKIDPSGMRFPPDADEVELREEPTAEMADIQEAVTGDHMTRSESTLLTGAERTSPAGAESAQRNGEVLKVSARSRPSAVAGAIAGVVRELGRAEVQAIGAGATNQAIKAVAIARDYLRETGIEAVCLPAFIDVTIDNEDRTAIRLIVEPR
jgi:stage V sporulation protein S